MKIENMEIKEGIQNWIDGTMISGEIGIRLPNNTYITVSSALIEGDEDWGSYNIKVHNLNDTEVTIFDKVTKRQAKYKGDFLATKIKSNIKEEEK
tara:strand:+ start:287 stop:571 length:285 start_codon:yes stop_codon:yes gene_type:complete